MAHAETTSSVSVLNAATKSLYLSATGHIKRHPVVVYEKTNQNREFEDCPIKSTENMAGKDGTADTETLFNNSSSIDSILPIYRLELVAVRYDGMLLDQVGASLVALEKRVSQLELRIQQHLRNDQVVVAPIQDLKELRDSVNQLKDSFESVRQSSPSAMTSTWSVDPKSFRPALSRPYWNRHKGRRRSVTEKRLVCEKFLQICELTLTEEIRHCLRMPTFDNWQWADEEILLLLQQMYVDLRLAGPGGKFPIDMPVLRKFLCQVYMNYNEVPFHNFHHCFCVSQMMYGIIWSLELPQKLGDLETLILLTSCICHDLDHPGFNNIYQINARTELALRYNDISPLENHHCSVAFNILEDASANILGRLDSDTFKSVREGMIRCILATDMARHNEIVNQFNQIISGFDYSNRAHVNLLCMVLIKVADISNEARPMDVAEPWLDCLLQEFYEQSDAEKMLGLPVTPFMDREKISKPSSQCSFIGFVLLPLFETIGRLFPQLESMIVEPVREALEYYRRLNEVSKDNRVRRSLEPVTSPSLVTTTSVSNDAGVGAEAISPPGDAVNDDIEPCFVLPLVLPINDTSPSTNDRLEPIEDRRLSLASEPQTPTETEVEVSEKTSNFKISTDTRSSQHPSHQIYSHAATVSSVNGALFRRSSLAFIATPSGATESGPGKAVDCSQPPSPRRVSPDGILYEANKVEATPALTVLLQVRRTTPTSPDSQVPPAPPTAAPVETSPGRVLPLLSRLRQWTDHWKSVTIGKPSSKVSSRRISLSLSRLFNRPLGRPSRPAVPAHRGSTTVSTSVTPPSSSSAVASPVVTGESERRRRLLADADLSRKLSSSLDSVVYSSATLNNTG